MIVDRFRREILELANLVDAHPSIALRATQRRAVEIRARFRIAAQQSVDVELCEVPLTHGPDLAIQFLLNAPQFRLQGELHKSQNLWLEA